MPSLLCCAKFQLKSKNRCYKLKNHTSKVLAPGEKSRNSILTAKLCPPGGAKSRNSILTAKLYPPGGAKSRNPILTEKLHTGVRTNSMAREGDCLVIVLNERFSDNPVLYSSSFVRARNQGMISFTIVPRDTSRHSIRFARAIRCASRLLRLCRYP